MRLEVSLWRRIFEASTDDQVSLVHSLVSLLGFADSQNTRVFSGREKHWLRWFLLVPELVRFLVLSSLGLVLSHPLELSSHFIILPSHCPPFPNPTPFHY